MNLDFSKAQSFVSRLRYGKRLYPVRDWLALLGIGLGLLLVSAGINAWLYYFGEHRSIPATIPASTEQPSPKLFADTDALLDARVEEEARYRSEYQFVDPRTPGS